jgi:hypothetical protein
MATNYPEKGFVASLFDFSFSSLITTRIIKVVYIILTVVLSLIGIVIFAAGLARGGGGGILQAILSPVLWLLYMIWARISLEVLIIIFRIGEDVRRIAYGPGPGGPGGYYPGPGPGYFPGPAGPPPSTPPGYPPSPPPPSGGMPPRSY